MSYDEPGAGAFGLIREQVEIDLGPEHLEALETIVDPVLVGEMPTIAWVAPWSPPTRSDGCCR